MIEFHITGANSPLGVYSSKYFRKAGFSVTEYSSRPKEDQRFYRIGDTSSFNDLKASNCLILHFARPSMFDQLMFKQEVQDLQRLIDYGVQILNIASVSGFMDTPNDYGRYKREIQEWLELQGQNNLVCGLLFGEDFSGQISRLQKMSRLLPLGFRIKGAGETYITPVSLLMKRIVIATTLEYKQSSEYLVTKIPQKFNWLLEEIVQRRYQISLSRGAVERATNLLPTNRYFHSDSLNGIFGIHQEIPRMKVDFCDEKDLMALWRRYLTGGA